VSDRATRQSEQSDGFGPGRGGYKQPIVPPAFRRSLHRLDTRGQPSTWFAGACASFSRGLLRHALNKRRLEPPVGLLTWCWLLACPLPVLEEQFTPQAGPGIAFGLPHTMHQPADTDRDSPRSPKPTSSIFTMEAREGRIGNSFACERCRKHKVRCVPSDTTGLCQRYGHREMWRLHSG
jgi:hypothetical protein